MKNKTIAVWITLLVGPVGLSRLYIKGKMDAIGWGLIVPTLLGLYGVQRARSIGLDDPLSWILIPLLGLSFAACALTAIVYGLMDTLKWNSLYNPGEISESAVGKTGWLTIIGVALSLFAGAIVLMSTIAFSFERYFEFKADQTVTANSSPALRKFAG